MGQTYLVLHHNPDVRPRRIAGGLTQTGIVPLSFIIEIDRPRLLPQLVAGLRAVDCSAVPISARACHVVHFQAESVNEAILELRFFAKAWAQAYGNVAVQLKPALTSD